jgi:DNA-binding transcriptional LysR family regulator
VNLATVETFLAVVSNKSISRAADSLHLSQCTVSLQMKSLEAELGILLFERHKGHRQLELTRKGQELVSIAERLLQNYKEARSLKYENKLGLSVSCVDSLNIYTFTSFYEQVVSGEPPMALRVNTHQSYEIYEHVENRSADVGLVLKQQSYPNVIVQPLFRESMKLALAPSFERPELPIHPRDLNFEQEVLLDWGPEFHQWRSVWCNPNISPRIQVDNATLVLRFLLEGERWSILPSSIIKRLQALAPIQTCPLANAPPDRICYKLTHRFPKTASIPSIQLFESKIAAFVETLNSENVFL